MDGISNSKPALIADTARVFLVWDTDSGGVSLYGIFASRKGAEEARRFFKDASWVEEREVLGDLIDGEDRA